MPASTPRSGAGLRPLIATRVQRSDVPLWRQLHAHDNGMMYALPSSDAALWRFLSHTIAYLIHDGVGCLVGGCTLTEVAPGIASIGIVIDSDRRAAGYGAALLAHIEAVLAPSHDFRVLRADVYAKNTAALHLLEASGFGEYRNFEKNLT